MIIKKILSFTPHFSINNSCCSAPTFLAPAANLATQPINNLQHHHDSGWSVAEAKEEQALVVCKKKERTKVKGLEEKHWKKRSKRLEILGLKELKSGFPLDDESTVVPMPPPPLPPPEPVFDPRDDSESFRFAVHCSECRECRDEEKGDQWLHIGSDGHCMMQPNLDEKFGGNFNNAAMGNECGNSFAHSLDPSIVSRGVEGAKQMVEEEIVDKCCGDVNRAVIDKGAGGRSSSKREKNVAEKNMCGVEREDPLEFITHRAKDFLSSIKDIEHRFVRPSESSREDILRPKGSHLPWFYCRLSNLFVALERLHLFHRNLPKKSIRGQDLLDYQHPGVLW
ncbi:hypothetical protein CR513_18088, partial [Mucuna pruriens]